MFYSFSMIHLRKIELYMLPFFSLKLYAFTSYLINKFMKFMLMIEK